MTKDYMKRRPTKQPSNRSWQLLLVLTSFLSGYLTATIFDINQVSTWTHQLLKKGNPNGPIAVDNKPKVATKPKFEFYTLLSSDRIKPNAAQGNQTHSNNLAKPVLPAPVIVGQVTSVDKSQKEIININPSAKELYQIQVAAFNKLQEAEKLKASLALQGFDVAVISFQSNRMVWYRVVIGPFTTVQAAEKAQVTVAKNDHIKGMIKKINP